MKKEGPALLNAVAILTEIERLIGAIRFCRNPFRRLRLNWRLWRVKRHLKNPDLVKYLTPSELIIANSKVANIRRLFLYP